MMNALKLGENDKKNDDANEEVVVYEIVCLCSD